MNANGIHALVSLAALIPATAVYLYARRTRKVIERQAAENESIRADLRRALGDDLVASIHRGIADAESGRTVDLGDEEQQCVSSHCVYGEHIYMDRQQD